MLDLVPVRTDQNTPNALVATVDLAQTADRLGYTRYWVAEHHNMPSVGATSPPVVIAYLAAQTTALRLGSGGVMLPNHAPLAVAEQFALLEAAAPGRIDLGIGRAPGSDPVTSYALRGGRSRAELDEAGSPAYASTAEADERRGNVNSPRSRNGRRRVGSSCSLRTPVRSRCLRLGRLDCWPRR